jgi:hypothetical protein
MMWTRHDWSANEQDKSWNILMGLLLLAMAVLVIWFMAVHGRLVDVSQEQLP